MVSVYDNKGTDTPLVIAGSVTNPTVYWIDGCPSFLSTSQCNAASISGPGAKNTRGALLSADRTRYVDASPYATVTSGNFTGGSHGFTINFPTVGATAPIASDSVGKIVIETQNDTFGLESITASSTNSSPLTLS